MPVKRPTVVSLAQLEQAAQQASLLAMTERQLADVNGGALAISKEPLIDPGTTLGMMPPREPDPTFGSYTLS